tara:strand:- start:320 stop:439 length:120 start_codon:yes stop_codon:yes gene_type:complete
MKPLNWVEITRQQIKAPPHKVKKKEALDFHMDTHLAFQL